MRQVTRYAQVDSPKERPWSKPNSDSSAPEMATDAMAALREDDLPPSDSKGEEGRPKLLRKPSSAARTRARTDSRRSGIRRNASRLIIHVRDTEVACRFQSALMHGVIQIT